MEAQAHDSVGTLADPLTDKVIVQVFDRAVLRAEFILSWLSIFQVLENFVLWMSILLFIIISRLFGCGLIQDLRLAIWVIGWCKLISIVAHA